LYENLKPHLCGAIKDCILEAFSQVASGERQSLPPSHTIVAEMSTTRRNVQFASHNEICAGWLYDGAGDQPAGTKGRPAIVLGHGIGAIKEMGLDRYSEVFSQAGYICLAFDYRYSGESSGKPRGLVDVSKQLQDWHSALDYIRSLPEVDPERVGIFGSSFGGGHVMQVGKNDTRVKAIISQCPFTNGLQSAMSAGISTAPFLMLLGIRDYLFGTDENPVRVALAAEPGGGELYLLLSPRIPV
jgi:dienelactone hydrolase